MASQFLVDGDLFVEVVDNDDGGGFSPKRVEELSRANKEGRYDEVAFPFERANGYNGVRQHYSRRGPKENIFRTAWGSSLNFEFIYDRSGRSMIPRWLGDRLGTPPTPSRLTRLDDNSVQLTTSIPEPRRIEVSTTFTLVPPHYIDLETACVVHPGAFEGEWLGLFWASYIHSPENKTTWFLGRPDENGPEQWIESLGEQPRGGRVFASEADTLVEGARPEGRPVPQHPACPVCASVLFRVLARHDARTDVQKLRVPSVRHSADRGRTDESGVGLCPPHKGLPTVYPVRFQCPCRLQAVREP